VSLTWADIGKASRTLGYQPRTRLRDGLARFVRWYRAQEGNGAEAEHMPKGEAERHSGIVTHTTGVKKSAGAFRDQGFGCCISLTGKLLQWWHTG
jgi:hypothetical protein